MFTIGTILKRREPVEGEFAKFNEVEVVAQSEVSSSAYTQDWNGQNAEGVLLTSVLEFSEVIDRPYGELERDYEIVSIPEEDEPVVEKPKKAKASQLSPEDAFRRADLAT
jgi:hypothetical protein